jgi:hypothetical protein
MLLCGSTRRQWTGKTISFQIPGGAFNSKLGGHDEKLKEIAPGGAWKPDKPGKTGENDQS